MKRTEPFDFYQPTTLAEASRLLKENGPGGRFLAGGTDLVIALKEKGLLPKYLVDLKRVPGLTGIREKSDGSITIGGNMANATPSADTAPALIALNASAKIVGLNGERTVALEDFFKGPGQTVMSPDEILTEITIAKTSPRLVGDYIKFSPREMMDLAYVGVAVAYNLRDKRCDGARIVLGAVAPTPLRAKRAEAVLEGQILSEALAERSGQLAAEEAKPISDVRSSADYRRAMVGAMTKRALLNAAVGSATAWVERRDRRY